MNPPESQSGKIGSALGIVAAGAAAGGAAGYFYMPAQAVQAPGAVSAKAMGAVAGAVAGAMLAGIGSLAVSEFFPHEEEGWLEVERLAALLGVGGVGLFGTAGLVKQLHAMKGNLLAPGGGGGSTPRLPASTSAAYTASSSDSGRTLNVKPGDTISVSLPAASGGVTEQWSWSASPGLVTLTSDTVAPPDALGNSMETAVFTATTQIGTGQIQGALAGATFVLNVNVIAPSA